MARPGPGPDPANPVYQIHPSQIRPVEQQQVQDERPLELEKRNAGGYSGGDGYSVSNYGDPGNYGGSYNDPNNYGGGYNKNNYGDGYNKNNYRDGYNNYGSEFLKYYSYR